MHQLWKYLSMGERTTQAFAIYLTVGIAMWTLTPGPRTVQAIEPDQCGANEYLCGSVCIPNDHVCCEDGSSGPSDSCVCCSECEDSSCTDPPTLHCLPED